MTYLKNIFAALSRTERIFFVLSALLAIGAGIGLCAIVLDRVTEVVPARGGAFVEGVVGQPTYVNPILAESDADKNLVRLVFANITNLAEKIEVDANGRVWNVRLKENLRWSDGKKMTSDDVIFTVEKMQDPETRSPFFSSWQGVSTNRLSELELQFNLVSPYPFFRENLKGLYPIPKHLFADTPSANWRLSDYNLKPVGSGPYAFLSYEKQENGFIQNYNLKRNDSYAGDTVFIENFSFRFFPNGDDELGAFNSGAIDGFGDLEPESFAKLNRSYQINSFPMPSYYAVFLNQSQNLALKESEVRQALNESVDRGVLIATIFGNRARISTSPILLATSDGVDPLVNKNDAISILDAAGWKPGENGIREKETKTGPLKLEFDLAVPKIPFLVSTAEHLRDAWSAIGAKVNLAILDPEEITSRTIKNREYQAVLFGNFLNPADDLYPFWHSNERFYPGLNLALYSNKKADQLIESIRREPNEAKRAEAGQNLASTIKADAPAVFLYSPNYTYIVSRDVRGIIAGPIAEPTDRYSTIAKWHVRTTRALR